MTISFPLGFAFGWLNLNEEKPTTWFGPLSLLKLGFDFNFFFFPLILILEILDT